MIKGKEKQGYNDSKIGYWTVKQTVSLLFSQVSLKFLSAWNDKTPEGDKLLSHPLFILYTI